MTAAVNNKVGPNEMYGHSCQTYLTERVNYRPLSVLKEDAAIVEAFHRRAFDQAYKAYDARIVHKRTWNSLLVQLRKASMAHSQALLVSNFYTALSTHESISSDLRKVLWLLFRLFAYHTMDNEARQFSQAKAVSDTDLDAIADEVQSLMEQIRPHAVNLVDAWSVPDYLLDSALGRYDGQVYEDLFERAHRLNPLNEVTFNPNWKTEEIVMGGGTADIDRIVAKL